jgi:RimJ/RimL family protein N-acetyltransferase
MSFILNTKRLIIREFENKDSDFIFNLLNTEDWLQNIGDRSIQSIDDAEAYIENKLQKGYQENGFGMYALSLHDETLVGMCGLVKRPHLDHPDIGFALLPKYYNQGFAEESAIAILTFAKEKLLLQNILAICIPSNQRSIHLIKKLGMKFKEIIADENGTELEMYSLV